MTVLHLISHVYLPLFDKALETYLKYFKLFIFFILPLLRMFSFRLILHYFSISISITKHLPISVTVLMMPCTTDPSFTSSTKSSAYYRVRKFFLLIESLYIFNNILSKIFFVQFEYNRPTCHWFVLFLNIALHAGIHAEDR